MDLEAEQRKLEDGMIDLSIEKMEEALNNPDFHSPQVKLLVEKSLKELTLVFSEDPKLELKAPKVAAFATLCETVPFLFEGRDLRTVALALGRKFFTEDEESRQLQLGTRMILSCPILQSAYDDRNYLIVEGKPEIKDMVIDDSQRLAELFPKIKPMIVKPLQWTQGGNEGGYLDIRRPLINNRHPEALNPSNKVLSAVNKIQNSAFCMHNRVLDVALEIGVTEDLPQRKRKGETKKSLENRIRSIVSSNTSAEKVISIAEEYRHYDNFWFTVYQDYRCRAYYAQQYFNGQGSDLSRGLLRFSQGKPLSTAKSVRWFMINIANLGGKDKIIYKERIKWVKRNHDNIILWATDPVANQGWKEGSIAKDGKPWQFLQSCFEYKEYIELGDKFLNHQPIALDAVCSGIQFWSALLLDKAGASSVAMMPGDHISDIYTDVMNVGVEALEACLLDDDGIAGEWLRSKLISRKLYKTPTMTICYSAGRRAFTKYVRDFCNRYIFKDKEKAIAYMVNNIMDSIGEVVKVHRGMEFLQECAKQGGGINYLSHIGFNVVHKPLVRYSNVVQCTVDGRRYQMTLLTKTDRIDERAIQTAIAPNFIHNLDSTLMMMLINACPNINSWLMCHDSFATHAVDVAEMAVQVRKCFVELLSQPLMERFRESMGAHKVEIPKKGDYELKSVLDAPYFVN